MTTPIASKEIASPGTGDLTINVIEYDPRTFSANGGRPILRQTSFFVSKSILLESTAGNYFRGLLEGGFKESRPGADVTLKGDTVASVEIWFRYIHNTLVDVSYLLPIKELWEVIKVSRKYGFHIEGLEEWFKAWWDRLDKNNLAYSNLRMLLFPCQEFDCAAGFAYVTKVLAHEGVGHVTELNPSDDYSLHCQGRVIQQINAARGSMRGKIVAGLFDPLDEFCSGRCPGREASIAAYLEGVKRTAIWPIAIQHRKSNKGILNSPGFKNWQITIPPSACGSCTARLSGAHLQTIDRDNTNYWQGLCLDCMDISKTKARDLDSEYWEHARHGEYSGCCRISHERNTWYFSYMGRPELMDAFKKEQMARKAARRSLFGNDGWW